MARKVHWPGRVSFNAILQSLRTYLYAVVARKHAIAFHLAMLTVVARQDPRRFGRWRGGIGMIRRVLKLLEIRATIHDYQLIFFNTQTISVCEVYQSMCRSIVRVGNLQVSVFP